MISQKLDEALDKQNIEYSDAFSSARWLQYFRDNKRARPNMCFPADLTLKDERLRSAVVRSLQRFQLGETGEGMHLKKYARMFKDPSYEQCIDMFIQEEQFHARVLAEMLAAMNATLLTWHWSGLCFVSVRRMLGLKTELLVLLIAEVIGKCFYRLCADEIGDDLLSDAFSLVVLDEIGHLEFHTSFLESQLKSLPEPFRYMVYYAWSMMFLAACLVFVIDHQQALKELHTTAEKFTRQCWRNFRRTARGSLGIPQF